jgi:hypothetical protein
VAARGGVDGAIEPRMTRGALSLLLLVLTGCDQNKTYSIDGSGTYRGDAIVTTDSALALPAVQVQLAAGTSLTLGPSCALSLTRASTESSKNEVNAQETDTTDLACSYIVAANQPCTLDTAGTSVAYDVTDGVVRVTDDGFVTISLGGVGGAATGGTERSFVYTFTGELQSGS